MMIYMMSAHIIKNRINMMGLTLKKLLELSLKRSFEIKIRRQDD